MTTAIDIQVVGIDIDDDTQMDAVMESLPDCSFAEIDGITIMTVFSEVRPLDDTLTAIRKLGTIPGARAVRVYADLVNMPQIAHRLGLTREAIRKWSHQDGFPEPVAVTNLGKRGRSSVWAWSEVATWLTAHKFYSPSLEAPTVQDVADINAHIDGVIHRHTAPLFYEKTVQAQSRKPVNGVGTAKKPPSFSHV